MSEQKWLNGVGEVCTWVKFEDNEIVSENKSISIKKDFTGLYKNTIRLEKYSDYLKKLLDLGKMTEAEFKKKMEFDYSNINDFKPQKDGSFCFISHIMHLPPQEEKADSPPIKISPSGWNNGVLDIMQNGKLQPYIVMGKDVDFKKDQKVFLSNVADDTRKLFKDGKISKKEMEEKLNKLKIKDEDGNPTEDFWLLYKGNIPPKK